MRAKQLKAWVAKIDDDAIVEGRERDYGSFSQDFQLRVVVPMLIAKEEVETTAEEV